MRCKKHYTDLSSTIGVCSCCLRERLLHLIAAQEHAETLETLKMQNSDHIPAINRSFSPHIPNRKSDCCAQPPNINHVHPRRHHSHSDQLFNTTPAVPPAPAPATSTVDNRNKKRRFIRFISFHNFFRSRNKNSCNSATDGGDNATSSSSKSSWFTTYIYGGKHRRKNTVCIDESIVSASSAAPVVRRRYCRDRGMSPARNSDGDETEDEIHNFSIGYESTTESWKNTPRRTPANNNTGVRRGGGHVRNVSGLTFCISPLVLRPSPNRKGGDCVGDIRVPVKPHLSNTKSFCANRSRKLADFGRPNQNH